MLLNVKLAGITQLLKTSRLDKEDMKNYHIMSNLPFISKLMANVVARYFEQNELHTVNHQLKVEAIHQIALLIVHSDITETLGEVFMVPLIMCLIYHQVCM